MSPEGHKNKIPPSSSTRSSVSPIGTKSLLLSILVLVPVLIPVLVLELVLVLVLVLILVPLVLISKAVGFWFRLVTMTIVLLMMVVFCVCVPWDSLLVSLLDSELAALSASLALRTSGA